MLTQKRHDLIMQLLEEKQAVKIQEIAELTNASESTIRRDLTELEAQQLLERVHGGATLANQRREEPSIMDKSAKNLHEKRMLAALAVSLIEEGDSIYLDAGTTTLEMIPLLKGRDVAVVTNGVSHMQQLMEAGITVYVTGGLIKSRTGAIVGARALEALGRYQFDKCFLGVNGIHEKAGYTTPDPEEAAMKQLASRQSSETFIVSDSSKYGKTAFAKIADLQDAVLVTDQLPLHVAASLKQFTSVKEADH
ncbi:DeoR/GlpR family DNA-binding transcription regulator [Indiicoccus explosivorum]|uniref:DeoR/GlpR family DNA-binding transcription regulator n=1 Tax=Indiicoccus explosivorum TaxID=1917864 RepID=UPI000B431461|nr:DeoR/GlpR family DNA-binding transcription regulator [Indiicoccus explosivorum]